MARLFLAGAAILCLGAPSWAAGQRVQTDPLGDAFNLLGGTDAVIDIKEFRIRRGGGDVTLTITCASHVLSPSAWQGALGDTPFSPFYGAFEMDFDQDPGTGFKPLQTFYFGPVDVGVDGEIDFFSEPDHPGQVDAHFGGAVTTVGVAYIGRRVVVTIPEAVFFGDAETDGAFNFAFMFGNAFEPTDAADEPGTFVVPAPSGAAAAMLGVVAWMAPRRRAADARA